MRINGNAIRPGNIVEHDGRLWRVTKIQHTQPGKGGACLQAEMKDIRDGTRLNERFRAAESIEKVRLDRCSSSFSLPKIFFRKAGRLVSGSAKGRPSASSFSTL